MASSNTIILGAGIIGCSTAYYLSHSPRTQAQSIHLVEASPSLFKCASGLAGGFIAADWFAPSVAPLGALSFKLHRELAEKHNGREKWGYSRSTSSSLNLEDAAPNGRKGEDWLKEGGSRAEVAAGRDDEGQHGNWEGPRWLAKREGARLETISTEGSVAQVDPLRLGQFLLEQCRERGVQLHHPARAISVSKDSRDTLASVRILAEDGSETDIPCTRLIITSGPWTPAVFSTLFPNASTSIPISPLAGHSLVVKSPDWTEAHDAHGTHAIFSTDIEGFAPEFISRLGGEIYFAGLNSTSIPLPNAGADPPLDASSIAKIRKVAANMLGREQLQTLREGLCFRPVTASGRPIISRIPDAKLGGGVVTRGGGEGGVFVAAGHGPWGISHSLGTGEVLADLVEGQAPSVNIKALEFA